MSEVFVLFRWSSVGYLFILSSFFLLGNGKDGFVGCIDLTYLRDSLINIRIRVLSPGRPSLGRMPHSPYFFLGAEYISPCCALPPLVYACVRWMLEDVKLICLSRAGPPSALYFAWSKEKVRTQIIRRSKPVPFVYPRIRLGVLQMGDEKSPQILSHFPDEPPRPGIEPGSPVWWARVLPLDHPAAGYIYIEKSGLLFSLTSRSEVFKVSSAFIVLRFYYACLLALSRQMF